MLNPEPEAQARDAAGNFLLRSLKLRIWSTGSATVNSQGRKTLENAAAQAGKPRSGESGACDWLLPPLRG